MPVLSTVGAASLGAFGAFKGFGVAGFLVATGGTIYVDPTDANYKIHEFTSSGTFTVTSAAVNATVQCVLVAGGGAGAGRGGGAGGYIYRPNLAITTGDYSVTIGAGGTTQDYLYNGNGKNSSFAGLVAIGGGGLYYPDGGSGAGQLSDSTEGFGAIGAGLQPTSASGGYGNQGGPALPTEGGGGGGAGGPGARPTGGAGRTSDIINSSGSYETMSAGGWGHIALAGGGGATALPLAGYGNGGWGGSTTDANGNYLNPGNGSAGILRVRYKFQ